MTVHIPESIPAVVLIADEIGHLTMTLLPGAQAASLRDLLGTPSWDSEGEDTTALLDAVREILARRRELAPIGDPKLAQKYGALFRTTNGSRRLADGTE